MKVVLEAHVFERNFVNFAKLSVPVFFFGLNYYVFYPVKIVFRYIKSVR